MGRVTPEGLVKLARAMRAAGVARFTIGETSATVEFASPAPARLPDATSSDEPPLTDDEMLFASADDPEPVLRDAPEDES